MASVSNVPAPTAGAGITLQLAVAGFPWRTTYSLFQTQETNGPRLLEPQVTFLNVNASGWWLSCCVGPLTPSCGSINARDNGTCLVRGVRMVESGLEHVFQDDCKL
jgi:hypothetical protein